MVLVFCFYVFACFGGFGGFWQGLPGALPTIPFDFYQIWCFLVVLVVFACFGGVGGFGTPYHVL